jgi:xanthine dehydrogenase YagT iron-sulfur-binding subunit
VRERLAELKARMKAALGAFTGDRRTEAKGRIEERAAETHVVVTEARLLHEEDEVRRAHGDMASGTPSELRDVDPQTERVALSVNGQTRQLELDTRTTLLDALRELLHLTGTKKGCDHGQCGACTVLVNGWRILSCLTLAVMHDNDEIVTIEGVGSLDGLHPLQAAFLDRDGLQCGYCTPGQICSAIGMLDEASCGVPSHVTLDVSIEHVELTDQEIRERMSGNICRCAAYPNILAAILDAIGGGAR